MRPFAILTFLCGLAAAPASAQTPVPTPAPAQRSLPANASIAQVLAEGYEIRAAFINNGVSYVFLQRQTSAYMCKSGASASCEKLN